MDEYTKPDRFGVYIHVPFCVRRCRYCAFFSTVRREIPAHEYVTALLHEADLRRGPYSSLKIRSLYLGGGTPSCLPDHEIDRLMCGLEERFGSAEECTIECNPEHLTLERARRWRESGLNRISLGVQSFNPTMLDFLGRGHSPQEACRALDCAHQAGFEEVCLDLIFGGTPDGIEPRRVWESDLQQAKRCGVEHVSCYALTIEPHTLLANLQKRGACVCVDEDTSAALMDMIEPTLGLRRYEISNYAAEGVFSAHNVSCWAGEPYLGLGPGAHSMIRQNNGVVRCEVAENITAYLQWAAEEETRLPKMAFVENLSRETHLAERLMCASRTRFCWSPVTIAKQVGADISPYRRSFEKAVARGLLEESGQGENVIYRTTELGIKLNNCLDEIIFEGAP